MNQTFGSNLNRNRITHHHRIGVMTRALSLAMIALIIAFFSTIIRAQDCNALTPGAGGPDDAATITNCLDTVGYARLTANTSANPFRLFQPIAVRRASGLELTGAGNTTSGSVLQPIYYCGQASPFVVNGQYQPVIQVRRAPNAVLSNFMLKLSELRKSCGVEGNTAIRVGGSGADSPGTRITGIRVVGSSFNDPGYTTGWAHGGGILVVNSPDTIIEQSVIKDLGFIGGGFAGIQVANSARSIVRDNNVIRVSFGIQVVNKSPSQGFRGDSSGTIITGNEIVGAASIGCPDCNAGRALKLEACGSVTEPPLPPLQHLNVTNNRGRDWSGPNFRDVFPSGLDLICGVQYSTFSGNSFIGQTTENYGLQIRSSFMSAQSASHHNVFTNNIFSVPFGNGRFDVFFESDGPDQASGTTSGIPSIGRRANGGNNSFFSVSWRKDRGCNQFAHAFFVYPSGQNFIIPGQLLTVAAAGIRPSSSSAITYTFKDPNDQVVHQQTFIGVNGNCVMNQQTIYIDPAKFVVRGLYKLFAEYPDGNSDVQITNDFVGTLDVR